MRAPIAETPDLRAAACVPDIDRMHTSSARRRLLAAALLTTFVAACQTTPETRTAASPARAQPNKATKDLVSRRWKEYGLPS